MKKRYIHSVLFAGALATFALSCADKPQEKSAAVEVSQFSTDDTLYELIGPVEGIEGTMVQFDSVLYKGGTILSTTGLQNLALKGVKTIISVTPDEQICAEAMGRSMTYQEFPFEVGYMDTAVVLTLFAILDSSQKPLYIHCKDGVQRAGNLCFAYRVYKQKWSFERALKEYRDLGGSVEQDIALLTTIYSLSNVKRNRE